MISRRDALKLTITAGVSAGLAGGAAFLWLRRDEEEIPPSETPSVETVSPTAAPTISTVGESGFDITLDSVRVSALGGVAAPGTPVSIVPLAPELPSNLRHFTTTGGQAVRIVLGSGQQPERPVTIEFALAGSQVTPEVADAALLAVLSYSQAEGLYFLSEGIWDAQKNVMRVEMDHLTDFWPIRIDLPDLFKDIVAELTLNYKYTKPDCAYVPLSTDAAVFSIEHVEDDSIWPCLGQQDGQIVLDLHSNSILPWAIKTSPSVSADISGGAGDVGSALAGFYSGLYGILGDQRSAVLPGNTATLRFSPDQPPTLAELKIEPGLFLGSILVWAIQSSMEILLLGTKFEDLVDIAGAWECLSSAIDATQEITEQQHYLEIINSGLSCIKESLIVEGKNWVEKAVASTALTLVTLFASGAGLIASSVIGIIKTISSTDRITFVVAEAPTGEPGDEVMEPVETVPPEDDEVFLLPPASRATVDIESRAGYKATLSISVGPEIGLRGVQPGGCDMAFIDISASQIYFKSRDLEFHLQSVTVNGFEWPDTRPVTVHMKGYIPCLLSPDNTGDYWSVEVYPGSPYSLTVVSGSEMSPKHPDGWITGPEEIVLVIEDSTQASCEAIPRSSGLNADFGTDFGGNSYTSHIGEGCRLLSVDNRTYEVAIGIGPEGDIPVVIQTPTSEEDWEPK